MPVTPTSPTTYNLYDALASSVPIPTLLTVPIPTEPIFHVPAAPTGWRPVS